MTLTHVVRILHITMSLPICPAHKYQMTYMSYTLELHVYPITMPSKPKLPEESSAQVDVHVDATCQGTQQLLLSSFATVRRASSLSSWIRFTFAVNSCSGSGSAALVSNRYQLA